MLVVRGVKVWWTRGCGCGVERVDCVPAWYGDLGREGDSNPRTSDGGGMKLRLRFRVCSLI